jgi:hypothetical protein
LSPGRARLKTGGGGKRGYRVKIAGADGDGVCGVRSSHANGNPFGGYGV